MSECALFSQYPNLAETISREELGCWPTPLEPLNRLSAYLGGKKILIKRDDLSNPLYGGNKIRKLELILAQAKKRGCREIITAGGLGSHHVLAAAALGKGVGLHVAGLFFCQPVTERVRHNLLLEHSFGTEMHFVKDYFGLVRGYLQLYLSRSLSNRKPMLLMPGGSNSLSTIGYINCLLEIDEQLRAMNFSEPEAIFCAAGTGGTAAGLLAGLALRNITATTVHAVRVVRPSILPRSRITGLARGALTYLAVQGLATKIPGSHPLEKQLHLEESYLGEGYGFSTADAHEATKLFRELEGIELEECYTAKAAAALIAYCRVQGHGDNGPVLFVHTASAAHDHPGRELPDPKELPPAFHWCFSDEARHCHCGLQKQNSSFCMVISRPGWRWPD